MTRKLGQLIRDEQGLETVEFAIVAGIIVAGTILTIGLLADWISAQFAALLAAMQSA